MAQLVYDEKIISQFLAVSTVASRLVWKLSDALPVPPCGMTAARKRR
jgi:hypothetical protein